MTIKFSGESVEENANLVIRLLIRRPECLGPALRGEGEGLLRAIIDANKVMFICVWYIVTYFTRGVASIKVTTNLYFIACLCTYFYNKFCCCIMQTHSLLTITKLE